MKPISDGLEKWNKIRQYIPYVYFKKMKVITGDIIKDEQTLKSLYNIPELEKLASKTVVANTSRYKRTETRAFDPVNVMGWLALVEHNSRRQELPSYSPKKMNELISNLKKASYKNSNYS